MQVNDRNVRVTCETLPTRPTRL